MKFKLSLVVVLLIFGATQFLYSQDDTATQLQQLKIEVHILQAQLDSLKAISSGTENTDDIENLEEQFNKRLAQLENKVDAISRATAPTTMNPKITAFFNLAGRHDNTSVMDYNSESSGSNQISNQIYLRSFELDFRSAIDPYADAVAILSVEDEAGTGYAVDPEEIYAIIKRLPILETAPLGLKLKLGRFRAPFGVSNVTHMHDLPWTTRPLVIGKFLGTEHGDFFEGGFNPIGADMAFILPGFLTDISKEVNISIVRSGELGLPNAFSSGSKLAFVSRLNLSKDWDNEHIVDLGLSFYGEGSFLKSESVGEQSTHLTLAGIDLTYKWAPAEDRESNSLVLGGEYLVGSHLVTDTQNVVVRSKPQGAYGYIQYQPSYGTYLGVRYDWLQEPTYDKAVTTSLAIYGTYYTSEFLRFRLGYENRWSDIAVQNNVSSIIFDVNVVFGSHPTEPYWVNR